MKTRATTLYPFVPSGPSFQREIEFLAELGFEKQWERDGYAGMRFGGAYFILMDFDMPDWQLNQMVNFEVDNLDAYWSEIEAKNLSGRFPGAKAVPPTDFPWGRELHIVAPGGVCWHVRQAG